MLVLASVPTLAAIRTSNQIAIFWYHQARRALDKARNIAETLGFQRRWVWILTGEGAEEIGFSSFAFEIGQRSVHRNGLEITA